MVHSRWTMVITGYIAIDYGLSTQQKVDNN
jgi:hypothetical protein